MNVLSTQRSPNFLSPAEPLGYSAGIDGLRALAVSFVLFFHADFPWMQGGFLGVSMFFTLSGFLITALLLREWWATSALDAKAFWSRRLRRLTPAAWTVLAGVLLLGALQVWDDSQLRSLRTDLPWSLADLLNWHFIKVDNSYGGSFSAASPVEHFWSLAVETQFYALLLIILIVVLCAGKTVPRRIRLNRLVVVLTVATFLSATANLL
ncbi:MAG: acyltransferase, partial [Microthrixaceae bacterium]